MSYFPLKVLFIKTSIEKVVYSPDELTNAGTFKVLATRVDNIN